MVEGAALEKQYAAYPYRGFESLPLRHCYEFKKKTLYAYIFSAAWRFIVIDFIFRVF